MAGPRGSCDGSTCGGAAGRTMAPLPLPLPLAARPSAVPCSSSLAKQLSLGVRASLASLGWGHDDAAAPPSATAAARRSLGAPAAPAPQPPPRQATPLLEIILWTSMAVEFVSGYASALDRKWFLSLPGVSEAVTTRACGRRAACATPDSATDGALHRAFFSAPPASLLVGVFAGAWLLRARGRRAALMAAILLHTIAFVTATAARSYYTLLAATLIGELSVGALRTVIVVVDAELAPPRRRLALVAAAVAVAFGLGSVNASCLVLGQSAMPFHARIWFWRVIIALGAWPCLLLLAIIPFVPESPLLLVQRGRTAEALQTLKDLRGPFVDVRAEFSGVIHACAEVEAEDARLRRDAAGCALPNQLRHLLSWRHWPSLLAAALLGALLGVCAAGDDVTDLVEVAVRPAFDNQQLWTLARVVEYAGATTGCFILIVFDFDRFSRRSVIAAGAATSVAAHLGLAALLAWPYGVRAKALVAAMFTLSGLVSLTMHGVLVPTCLLLPAELTGTGLRSAVVAAALATSRLCRVAWGLVADSPYFTARLHLSSALTAALVVVLAALCWLFVPDGTQRVPLEECRRAWQKHWYWGRHAERWAFDLPHRRSSR